MNRCIIESKCESLLSLILLLHIQWRRNEFESGAHVRRETREIYLLSCRSTFLSRQGTISRFCERFRDGQYSLISFLFVVFYSRCPPSVQPFVKVGRTRAPVLYGVGATEHNI